MLFTMLLLYPALHEAGHLMAAVLTGERVTAWSIFPTAFVTVAVGEITPVKLLLPAVSGIWFPLVILPAPAGRRYPFYFIKLTVALLTAVGALTSLTGLFGLSGIGAYDDIAAILPYAPSLRSAAAFLLLIPLITAVLFIILSKPVDRTVSYFSQKTSPHLPATAREGSSVL